MVNRVPFAANGVATSGVPTANLVHCSVPRRFRYGRKRQIILPVRWAVMMWFIIISAQTHATRHSFMSGWSRAWKI